MSLSIIHPSGWPSAALRLAGLSSFAALPMLPCCVSLILMVLWPAAVLKRRFLGSLCWLAQEVQLSAKVLHRMAWGSHDTLSLRSPRLTNNMVLFSIPSAQPNLSSCKMMMLPLPSLSKYMCVIICMYDRISHGLLSAATTLPCLWLHFNPAFTPPLSTSAAAMVWPEPWIGQSGPLNLCSLADKATSGVGATQPAG